MPSAMLMPQAPWGLLRVELTAWVLPRSRGSWEVGEVPGRTAVVLSFLHCTGIATAFSPQAVCSTRVSKLALLQRSAGALVLITPAGPYARLSLCRGRSSINPPSGWLELFITALNQTHSSIDLA